MQKNRECAQRRVPCKSARDTRKEAMTKPRFKEVVPYDQHAPEPAGYSPTPDQP
jgi:hypothetical protein